TGSDGPLHPERPPADGVTQVAQASWPVAVGLWPAKLHEKVWGPSLLVERASSPQRRLPSRRPAFSTLSGKGFALEIFVGSGSHRPEQSHPGPFPNTRKRHLGNPPPGTCAIL